MSPWKRWAIQCVTIGGVIFVMVGVFRSFVVPAPIIIPNWPDSLANLRDNYTMDSTYWKERHEADSLRAETWKEEAERLHRRSLSSRPARPPRVGAIPPDSGMADSVANNLLIAQNDSLWTALDAGDSAYTALDSALTAQREATAAALSGWAAADSALLRERNTAQTAIRDLTGRLRKARRGSRLFGLLPLPSLYVGLGATMERGGRVVTGPTVGVGVRVAF